MKRILLDRYTGEQQHRENIDPPNLVSPDVENLPSTSNAASENPILVSEPGDLDREAQTASFDANCCVGDHTYASNADWEQDLGKLFFSVPDESLMDFKSIDFNLNLGDVIEVAEVEVGPDVNDLAVPPLEIKPETSGKKRKLKTSQNNSSLDTVIQVPPGQSNDDGTETKVKKLKRRRRRNEYDFGHKKRKTKKKETKNVVVPNTQDCCDVLNDTRDADSMNLVKDLYEHSEAKRLQQTLFGGSKEPEGKPTQQNFGLSRCCSSHKMRSNAHNNQRAYRRKHGLWIKGDRVSQRLLVKNFKFPFDDLPVACKFKIFNMLGPVGRGVAAQVCQSWRMLIMDPDSWRDLDLNFLASTLLSPIPATTKDTRRKIVGRNRYESMKTRARNFMNFLYKLVPRPARLAFQFDIGHQKDNWFRDIELLFEFADMCRLTKVDVDWQNTPGRPTFLDTYCCIFNKVRLLFSLHMLRLSIFQDGLDQLTRCSPEVRHVTMPFDWSPRSVLLISRWRKLTSVNMKQYLNMLPLQQSVLDAFLRSHPDLEHLSLATCCPLFSATKLYALAHATLQTLDLSECKGFYVQAVYLPQLRELHLSTFPCQRALFEEPTHARVPCIYNVLKQGAPVLETINGQCLNPDWKQYLHEDFDYVLKKVCICVNHNPQPNSGLP